jgi:DNA-binding transcriptional MerR regulator
MADEHRDLMTVGELAERTGISRKAIRDLEQRGLVYSAGRSESNYRLYDEEALWCVRMITDLRSLGLTLAEIQQFGADYQAERARWTAAGGAARAGTAAGHRAAGRARADPAPHRGVPGG